MHLFIDLRKTSRSNASLLINKYRKRRQKMRFMEIANPEDQLALWKLVSDKMWAAFAQQIP